MPSLRHAIAASALIVLAMTAAVCTHASRAPRAPGPTRRTGVLVPRTNATSAANVLANATSAAKELANASARAPVLAVPLVPLLPRGAPFWVSNASAHAGAPNRTGPGA